MIDPDSIQPFANEETVEYQKAADIPNDETVVVSEPQIVTGKEMLAKIDTMITGWKDSGVWNKMAEIYDFRFSLKIK